MFLHLSWLSILVSFTDSYYTTHTLGNHLKDFTDIEAHLIGTCKTSIMDSTNLLNVWTTVTKMAKNDVKRNSWILVRACDKPVKTITKGLDHVKRIN